MSPTGRYRPRRPRYILVTYGSPIFVALPWERCATSPVRRAQGPGSTAPTVIGLIRVEAGMSKPEHLAPRRAPPHTFITHGSCVMLGTRVDEGSHVYVLPGVRTRSTTSALTACGVLQCHRTAPSRWIHRHDTTTAAAHPGSDR